MTSSTTLTVLIPWSNRPELATTLQANTPMLRARRRGARHHQLRRRHGPASHVACNFELDPFIVDASSAPFNRSLALNLGAACSTSHFLFMLDADVLLDEGDVAGNPRGGER